MISRSTSPRLRAAVGWLGLVTAVGMFLVLIAGDTVTTTGSAQGCARDWPLCRGQFVPEFAISTAIEYTHRLITAAEGILVVVLTAGLLKLYWSRASARVLSVLLVGSVVLQAGMGAWAVMQPQAPTVLALHFGISLIAFAAAVLAALIARWPERTMEATRISPALRVATWGMAVYLYALIYTGAFIRHAAAAYACPNWPLCGTSPAPGALEAVNLLHRGAAGLALVLAIGLIVLYSWQAPARRDLVTGGWLLIATLGAQAVAGAFLVTSRWSLYGELLHAGVTAFVFAAAAYLCFRVTVGTRAAAGAEARPPSRKGSEQPA